jgi:hypothetical protein
MATEEDDRAEDLKQDAAMAQRDAADAHNAEAEKLEND